MTAPAASPSGTSTPRSAPVTVDRARVHVRRVAVRGVTPTTVPGLR